MRLYFTSPVLISAMTDAATPIVRDTLIAVRAPEGMPFILLDDGRPAEPYNEWLRSLPTLGAPSPATWTAYARDLVAFLRFCSTSGADPLRPRKADIGAYYAERRLGPSEKRQKASSWTRGVHALQSFYQWAYALDLVDQVPFFYRESRPNRFRRTGARNLAVEKTRRPTAVTWLAGDQVLFFLDVGLGGLLPDGAPDPSFRGFFVSRNVAFAELLVSAGLRCQEANSLLTCEIPTVPARSRAPVELLVPEGVSKGGVEHTTLLALRALRTLRSYRTIERSVLPADELASDRALLVENLDRDTCRVGGSARSTGSLSVRDRLVLRDASGRSPLTFLKADGGPMTTNAWNKVFARATARCKSFNPYFPKVSPHTLRHTFAVHTLRRLLDHAGPRTEGPPRDRVGYDPLLVLRDFMGHASVTTTEKYLQLQDRSRLLMSEELWEQHDLL
jgi:site-specific recombinase XerD